ncbi:PREDICTED: JNK1/MAPK8-associated membrane protein-like isoform X2 [Branchiostoma belcheri]|uniref:JNK1/MAPK8-associated membrane protein-like isoform X1 n=1 Tax=Branchiostoma belcheri TaxID=7741 RepID=A0A6P5AZP8_BRABE|nr:PREDICTED: JNK1/MAPK8-associated membrane protein-like isoform X1 [Branchiostoma belcheri]XP_019647656.1 PREDICTED: JNK1/MAPK8-associated membrane protein-like isoform X2 [Branchiostoma belcheri]
MNSRHTLCFVCSLVAVLVFAGVGSAQAGSQVCPGLYCGKTLLENNTYSQCGACPRGYIRDDSSVCRPCDDAPSFYDWLYLSFMVLASIILHWFFIDWFSNRQNIVLFYMSALVECVGAALLTLVMVEPVGTLSVRSCSTQRLSDWYTILYNPSPGYTSTLHCTQEAVYPLYTMVFMYYAVSLCLMLLFRPLLSNRLCKNKGAASIYAALYFIPILVVIHAVGAGLIYYAFPYIVIVASVLTNAVYFAQRDIQNVRQIVSSKRNILILCGHWIVHAFGIIAITGLKEPAVHGPLLSLTPTPAIFYLLTVKFTEPSKFQGGH